MDGKILIIENDKLTRALLGQKLKREGYEVLEADSGPDGLSMMNEFMPDLVLLETDLPQFSGLDVLEEMNKSSTLRHIPVIVIASPSWQCALERFSELGAQDWLIKTEFDPRELLEKVDRCINK